jgi:hypothetical protein
MKERIAQTDQEGDAILQKSLLNLASAANETSASMLENFLRVYIPLRKQYHLRRFKLEKLNESLLLK